MQVNDGFEEVFGNRSGGVWMARRNEVSVLGEAVHHGQDDTVAMDAGKAFNEVKGDVRPHLGGDLQRLQQSRVLQRLDIVPLTHRTRAHKVAHQGAVMVGEELRVEAMQHPLEALVKALVWFW